MTYIKEMALYVNPILLDKLFSPNNLNSSKKKNLQIDYESLYSITLPQTSHHIVQIINDLLFKKNINHKICSIIDATAGVGGDTISFSSNFNKVYSIEINPNRYSFLINNLNIYNIQNVITYNDSYLNLINKINSDIVFIDPPWGGRSYKHIKNLKLYLDNKSIENICLDILSKNIPPKLIVLKLPNNYYFDNFHIHKLIIYKYFLYKMTIIVINSDEQNLCDNSIK